MNNYENIKKIMANLARINSCIDRDYLNALAKQMALDYSKDVSSLLDLLDFLLLAQWRVGSNTLTVEQHKFTNDAEENFYEKSN